MKEKRDVALRWQSISMHYERKGVGQMKSFSWLKSIDIYSSVTASHHLQKRMMCHSKLRSCQRSGAFASTVIASGSILFIHHWFQLLPLPQTMMTTTVATKSSFHKILTQSPENVKQTFWFTCGVFFFKWSFNTARQAFRKPAKWEKGDDQPSINLNSQQF